MGIADDGLGAECPCELEVLLEATGVVGAGDVGVHAAGDDPGLEPTGCAWQQLAVKDENYLVRSPQVEMVADHALEEGAPGLRSVEHARVGDLELAERQL